MDIGEDLASQEALLRLDDVEIQASSSLLKDAFHASCNDSDTVKELTSIGGQKILFAFSLTGKLKSISVIMNESQIFVDKHDWSKDLKQIDSIQLFDAYFKNAYIKTIPFSDGTIKLEVKQKIVGGMPPKAVLGLPLPPVLIPDPQLQNDIVADHTSQPQQPNYMYGKLSPRAVEFNDVPPIIRYHGVGGMDIECYVMQDNDKNLAVGEYTNLSSLHPTEKLLFQAHLSSFTINQVVLFEMFNLGKTGIVSCDGSGNVNTHFIVLWHQGNRVTVIEPNNMGYSTRLIPDLKNIFIPNGIDVEHKFSKKDYLYGDASEVYKRDCRDVAAKIAFEIKDLSQNPNRVYNNDLINTVLYNISNQSGPLAEYIKDRYNKNYKAPVVKEYRNNYFSNLGNIAEAMNRAELSSNMDLKCRARDSFIEGFV